MRGVFLDRDGVIVRDSDDYLRSAESLEPLPGAVEALVTLSRAGFALVVVSNQQGVALGHFPESELARMEVRIESWLGPYGVSVARWEYATGPRGKDPARKPSPAMLLRAGAALGFDPAGRFFVGDRESDMAAALACGARPLLVRSGKPIEGWEGWAAKPERIFATLGEAAAYILHER